MIDKRLINLLSKSKIHIVITVLFHWIALIGNVFSIFFMADLLEKTILKRLLLEDIYRALIVITIVIIVRFGSRILADRHAFKASSDVKLKLREKIYQKLLDLGIAYDEKLSTSSAVQIAVEGVEQLEMFFSAYLPQLLYSLLAPISLFLILSFISLKSALVLLVCVPLIPVSIMLVQKFAKRLFNKYWGQYTSMGDSFLENLHGLTTLKIYQRDQEYSDAMDLEAEEFRKVTMRVLTMQLNSITMMDLVAYGGAGIGIILAIFEFKAGNISFSDAFIVIMLSAEFFIPLRRLGSFFHVAMNGMAASDKIFELLELEVDAEQKIILDSDKLSMRFKGMSFNYEGKDKVLNDLNFTIEKGEMVGLVGESGSGKSTLARLIMGMKKGYEGIIEINGFDLQDIKEKSLMKQITFLDQNSYLFKGTVRTNLLMADNEASDALMLKVLDDVDLLGYLKNQNGLDTHVLENASNFSGGQQQRLLLARAILKDSSTYIFDEVTSNIDVESELKIMEVIKELSLTKTIILISHRLKNVAECDKIYVLNQGHVAEQGNHHALIQKRGLYSKLYHQQEALESYSKTGVKVNA